MRKLLLPTIVFALTLRTASPASGQVQIDTSSPDAAIASLAELHESWTLSQFTEFLRAAMIAQLPDAIEDQASWHEGRNRWEFIEEGLAGVASVATHMPFFLERDPFLGQYDAGKLGPSVQAILHQGLQDRTISALVDLGRKREQAVLTRLLERYRSGLAELERQIDDAEAAALRSGVSVQERRAAESLERRLVNGRMRIERLARRFDELERATPFDPGTVDCGLEEGVDVSTETAMMADLEALADTCPQQRLIRFLRAAAFVSQVPAQLAEPGARMVAASVMQVKSHLSSDVAAIAGLAAVLQHEPFARDVESVPARLRKMLKAALDGRAVTEVMTSGDKLEHAFLVSLRSTRSEQLRSEIAKSQDRTSGRQGPAPNRPSGRIRELRAEIERIDRRLDRLRADASGGAD